jgi:4-hydroxythreonine-4-phosphate dehydrogenase
MTQRWLILADDLTGAADCGIAFARRGLEASVGWHGVEASSGAAVLAVDADSRRLSPEAAAARHVALLRAHHRVGQGLIKKIDSTLRGQPAAELAATCRSLREAGQGALAIVAPAFPATGRTTEGGRVHMNGTPLEATPLWARDHSYASAVLPEVLESVGLSARLLPLGLLRQGKAALAAALQAALDEGLDAVVCDAEEPGDLDLLAQASLPLAGRVFWVGSGGIAAALAAALPGERHADASALPALRGGVLVVVGSIAEASRAAAARLVVEDAATAFEVPAELLRAGPVDPRWATLSAAMAESLTEGRDTLVAIAATPDADLSQGAALAESLAALLTPVASCMGGLFATGGETACALLSHLGVHGIRLLEELEPGVPLGVTQGALRVPVMTKAGAFGDDGTILRSLQRLRALSRDSEMSQNDAKTDGRPIVAITMGDASGIGPEIIMKALAREDVYAMCRPLVIGDATRLREADAIVKTGLQVNALSTPAGARYTRGMVDCIDLGVIPAGHPFGQLSSLSGEGAYRYIERATRLVEAGEADAICTAPLSKEALHAAGHKFPGHTELLAHLTGTPEVSMMLVAPKLRVIHVTTHIGLIDAIRKIEPGLVQRVIARGHATLVKSGITEPRIGVCAINPHAGENGLFGQGEEEEKIIPAIKACQAEGWKVEGPLPADTLFFRAARGDFDLVVAMYHDQGHGPVKVMGLESGVNITVGLPVIRTSVDHGTAFDIAGKGIADEGSLVEALKQAVELAPKRSLQAA